MGLAATQHQGRCQPQPFHRLLWALWCCVAAAVPASGAVADTSLELQSGDAAFSRGEYHAAVRHYSAVIDAAGDAKAALLFTKRAAAYLGMRQNSQALRDLNQAVEMDPTYTQGILHRGRLHKQLCQVASARYDFNAVLALKSNHKAASAELESLAALESHLAALGAKIAAGDDSGARSALEAVYGAAPDCLDAELAEARLEYAAANYEQVVAVTGRMLKSQPSQLEALTLRGRSYFYLGDHDLAKRHFGEALKYDPDAADARQGFNKVKEFDRKRARADKALEANEWAEAEKAFMAALAVDPQHKLANVGLWFGMCRAQRHGGKAQEAVQSCESVLQLEPGHEAALQERVRALIDAERFDEAQMRAREALEVHRNNRDFHMLYQEAERAVKISKRKDYYKVLGVPKDADTRTIKKYYKALARLYHPDKVTSEADKKESEEKFREVAEAYEILVDDDKRAAYDRGEDMTGQAGGGGGGGPWGHPGHQQFHFHHPGGQQFHFTF